MDAKNIRVLVIDDNDLDREAVFRLIYDVFCVLEAKSGAQGWQIAMESKPACVLLDYRLPDVNGLELLQRFVESEVPVVLLTGQGSEQIAAEAIKVGAEDYLPKSSLDRTTLSRTVSNAIEKFDLRLRVELQQRDATGFVSYLSGAMTSPLQEIADAVDQISEQDTAGESVDAIRHGLTQLNELITAMLDYTHVSPLGASTEKTDLEECVEHALAVVQEESEAQRASFDRGRMPIVVGNKRALMVVFEKLIRTAIDTAADRAPTISIQSELADSTWAITVSNCKKPTRQQSENARESWAIGGPRLMASATIIRQLGGDSWATTDPDGVHFQFTLPHREEF